MKEWQKEYYKPIIDEELAQAAYYVGWANGVDGAFCDNPYTIELERHAYDNGRRDGEAYYRKHAYSEDE
jgi:hypothetical protein